MVSLPINRAVKAVKVYKESSESVNCLEKMSIIADSLELRLVIKFHWRASLSQNLIGDRCVIVDLANFANNLTTRLANMVVNNFVMPVVVFYTAVLFRYRIKSAHRQ